MQEHPKIVMENNPQGDEQIQSTQNTTNFSRELVNINLSEKAKIFNEFFSKQCTLILNDSVLPPFNFVTDKRIDNVPIRNHEILKLIRNLNPNKATGSDGISAQMLLLCDESVVLPLKIIFQNILDESVYPEKWKLEYVTPIHKKDNK